nr:MAG TPA: hypothetical protein [Caudoviricetes sp.]
MILVAIGISFSFGSLCWMQRASFLLYFGV